MGKGWKQKGMESLFPTGAALRLEPQPEPYGRLVKTDCQAPPSGFLIQETPGGAWEVAFLVSSQEMLMLLGQGLGEALLSSI